MKWYSAKDGDTRAFALMKRHYSFRDYKDGRRSDPNYRNRKMFVGPGEKIVLLTPMCDALFVWRKFIDDSGQKGINCSVFRNESEFLSSDLIREAEDIARVRWPGQRFYTYVDPKAVASKNPGYCFMCAGWKRIGYTKSGKLILEKDVVAR